MFGSLNNIENSKTKLTNQNSTSKKNNRISTMVRKSLKTMAKIWCIFCLALLAIWEARANELELSSLSNDNQFPLVGLGVGNLAHESIAAMIGDAGNHEEQRIQTPHLYHCLLIRRLS